MQNQNWDNIRIMRDHLLGISDWTQMPDTNLTEEQQQAWRDYRSKLRNITASFRTPLNVEWPPVPN